MVDVPVPTLGAASGKSPFAILGNLETLFSGSYLHQEDEDGEDSDKVSGV